MNILLFSHVEVSAVPKAGGIQRVTQLLAEAFIANGYDVFHSFFSTNNDDAQIPFLEKIQLAWGQEYEQLKPFLQKNKIDFVIFQNILGGGETLLKNVRQAANEANSKIIFCLHVSPDSCLTKPSLAAEFYRLTHWKIPKVCVKRLITASLPRPIYNYLALKQAGNNFKIYNKYCDKIVLLSQSHIDIYNKISKNTDNQKVTAIPNPLTFSDFITEKEFDEKQNEILILCRLSERQKRVTESLKIWQKVQNQEVAQNWRLVIVGGGEDEDFIKKTAKNLKLKNISFEGFQHPLTYFKSAKIFMMTSAHEGFGMTLVEAQQNGAVPMAFDSFTALHDILENEKNGIIIENQNFTQYAEKLVDLMKNEEKRILLGKNAIETCKKFSTENIVNQWNRLLDEMK